MAQTQPRASHVVLDVANSRLCVVYPGTISKVDLALVAANFQTETGFRARDLVFHSRGTRNQLSLVAVTLVPGRKFVAAMATLKRMTNPRLPIAIQALDLDLLICRCQAVRPHVKYLEFVPGFEPADAQKFKQRLAQMLRRCPLSSLMEEDSVPPYSPLLAKAKSLLFDLGAYAALLRIQPCPETKDCKH